MSNKHSTRKLTPALREGTEKDPRGSLSQAVTLKQLASNSVTNYMKN